MANFKQILTKLNLDYDKAVQQGTQDSYARLATIFEELSKYLREYIREKTTADMLTIIRKLKQGAPLTPEYARQLRMWVVEDAEHATKLESHFADWKIELKRVMNQMSQFQIDEPDVETAHQIRGIFREGTKVLANITHFLEQKDRLEKFNSSLQKDRKSTRLNSSH